VIDTTSIAHKDMTIVDLYYDAETSGQVTAFRCVEYSNATGGSCGDVVHSTSTGVGLLHLPKTPASFATDWNSVAHFAYIGVYLPPMGGAGQISRVKGFYTAK
jgi:hypothetical protein